MTLTDPTVTSRRRPWLLIGLLGFTGMGALYGGIGLIDGGLGMPIEWLDGSPFQTWVVPGLALLGIVAIPSLWALIEEALGAPTADRTAMIAGGLLVAWIVVQVLLLQRFHPLQPTMLAVGLLTAWLAWRRSAAT
jgi:hypothetical protein